MNVGMMKRSAEKLIAANGRKETLAALSGFAQVAGPEEVLELIKCHEQALDERQALAEKVREWERCAANWMASPEAQQRQAGYQELAGKLAAATTERDTARQQAATLRAALVNVMGGDDKEWLGRARSEAASFVSIYGPNRKMGYAAYPKFLADAVGILLATHLTATTQPAATPIAQTAPCQECNGFEHLACACQEKSA